MSDRTTHPFHHLPVVVVGAGPIGLAAAVHLRERGLEPLVLEAGAEAGAAVRRWGHVRVFSPWKYMVDPLARRHLEAGGWEMPDSEALPTGAEFADRWLDPLAASLGSSVRTGTRVYSVGRWGVDKTWSARRHELPFQIDVHGPDGHDRVLARAVIDASGTLASPNPLGANGAPLPGEGPEADGFWYGIPDVLGRDRARFAGRRVLVAGSGHSAFHSLLALSDLRTEAPGTEVVWAIRRKRSGALFGGGDADELEARGRLGTRVRHRLREGAVRLEDGFRASDLRREETGWWVSDGARDLGPFDHVVVNAGYRPDHSFLREVRLDLDPALECPPLLAPLIDPNVHSCGTVYPHGHRELGHPEQDFWIVGSKSYGRAPTFLLLTGYEQVRSVAASLAGDHADADAVRLELPTTGVCGVPEAACC